MALMLGTGACSVATPPRVSTLARPASAPPTVRIETAETTSPEVTRFAAALERALAARGIATQPNSEFVIALALARRPASMGIGGQEPAWLNAARPHRWFDACRPVRISVSLQGGASPEARMLDARGGFDACRVNDAQIERLAEAFAAGIAGN